MKKRLYEAAETLVYDPVASNRNATRASLHTLGFRKVEFASSMETLEAQLKARAPDLLFCEVAGAETEVCNLLQAVRQGTIGTNPFIVAIATTWRRDGTIVGQVLNSGADDLLARPFSTVVLGERIRAHIERRKGFVVTTEYIGPDRRRDSSRSGAECIDVPNSLQVKTDLGLSDEEAERTIAEEVKRGWEVVNGEKMRRDAFQLCVQWRLLEQRRPGARDFFDILARMEALVDEIRRRSSGRFDAAAEWCQSVLDSVHALTMMMGNDALVDGIDGGIDFGAPMHLLGHAALTLGQMFAPGEVEPTQLVELDAVVARMNVRRERERKQSLESLLSA